MRDVAKSTVRQSLLFFGALLLFSIPAAGQRRSVAGWVSDAGSHRRIENVLVELRAVKGGVFASTVTGGNGNFEFDNVPDGGYDLVGTANGYDAVSQHVEVQYGPVSGIEIEIHRTVEASTIDPGGPNKVSVRDLSIPPKARDAMEKGINLLYRKMDYQGSLKQFQKAIEVYPGYYEAYAQMGVAHMKLGDASATERALRQSIEVSHDHYVDAFCMLSALFSDTQRFAEAEPLARKGTEIDPSSWQANSALARALIGLNRNKEAETSAQAAIRLEPHVATLYLLLANAHIKLQNYVALLDDLNAYLKLDPSGPSAEQARKQRDALYGSLSMAQASPASSSH